MFPSIIALTEPSVEIDFHRQSSASGKIYFHWPLALAVEKCLWKYV